MPSAITLLLAAGAGSLVGHGVRRAIPSILGLRDRQLPFARPWMEIVTAVAFVLVVRRFGVEPSVLVHLAFASLLVATTATDYRSKLIPDRLTLGGTLIGTVIATIWPARLLASPIHIRCLDSLGLPTAGPWAGAAVAVGGALFGLLMLESIRLTFGAMIGTDVMGMGDSKLLMMIGAFLGPIGALGTLLLSFFLGVVHGAVMVRLSGQPHSPFGPPLAAAALAVLVAGTSLVHLVVAFQRLVLALPLSVLAGVYTVLLVIAIALLLRTRRRAAEYEEMIEADYRQLDDELDG